MATRNRSSASGRLRVKLECTPARIIEFKDHALINTMAASPDPDYPLGSRAQDGHNLGEDGKDGVSSGSGGNAGDVLIIANQINGPITITAEGQRGGNAQGGGNGMSGQPGQNGKECNNGGDGGAGGRGGLAGKPGDGGNGGKVVIVCTQPEIVKIKSISVKGGEIGVPAQHGSSGDGGNPGSGGIEGFRDTRYRCEV